MFRIKYKPSTSHWIFPRIIIGILIILGIALIIQRAIICHRNRKPFFDIKDYHFFVKGYDKVKFWGGIAAICGFIFSLKRLGFIGSSMIFITLLQIIYDGVENVPNAIQAIKTKQIKGNASFRCILTAFLLSTLMSSFIYFFFGVIFKISLP